MAPITPTLTTMWKSLWLEEEVAVAEMQVVVVQEDLFITLLFQ